MWFAEEQEFCAGEGLETGYAEEGRFEDFNTGAFGGGQADGRGGKRFSYCMDAVFREKIRIFVGESRKVGVWGGYPWKVPAKTR